LLYTWLKSEIVRACTAPNNQRGQYALAAQAPDAQTATRFGRRCHGRYRAGTVSTLDFNVVLEDYRSFVLRGDFGKTVLICTHP